MAIHKRNDHSASSKAVEAVKNVEKKVEQALTCLWDDLPSWQRDNHYIISGYRPGSFSFKKSIASLSYLHNETVNVYSHLLGAILFTLLGIYIHKALIPRYPTSTHSDVLAFTTFILSAFLCLTLSATYHLLSNHSPQIAKLGNKLDYLGIIILIVGSFVPIIHYTFWCHQSLVKSYWGMITLLGSMTAVAAVTPAFRTPAWRPWRAGMFVALGASAVFPVLHAVGVYGVGGLDERMGLRWVVAEGILYTLGAGLYAARIPERYTPGKYDIYGSSHQIFHFLVVAAASAHLVGLVKAFDYIHAAAEGTVCL